MQVGGGRAKQGLSLHIPSTKHQLCNPSPSPTHTHTHIHTQSSHLKQQVHMPRRALCLAETKAEALPRRLTEAEAEEHC